MYPNADIWDEPLIVPSGIRPVPATIESNLLSILALSIKYDEVKLFNEVNDGIELIILVRLSVIVCPVELLTVFVSPIIPPKYPSVTIPFPELAEPIYAFPSGFNIISAFDVCNVIFWFALIIILLVLSSIFK